MLKRWGIDRVMLRYDLMGLLGKAIPEHRLA